MQRMRTITQAYEYLKEQDPDTAITKTAFFNIVKQGLIPVTVIGKKKLINLNNVERFFEDGMSSPIPDQHQAIRAIDEKTNNNWTSMIKMVNN